VDAILAASCATDERHKNIDTTIDALREEIDALLEIRKEML
jgi:hypothetical protein